MTEPRRLFDEAESELERSLLEAGTDYRSPIGARQRTLEALGITASAYGSIRIRRPSLLANVGGVKAVLAATALAAAAVPAGYYAFEKEEARTSVPSPPAAAAASNTAASKAPAAAVKQRVSSDLEEGSLDPAETQAPPAPAAPKEPSFEKAPKPAPGATPRAQDKPVESKPARAGLAAELGALEAARAALGRRDATRALALLDAHARDFPRGRLKQEAEVMRIDALAESGQRAAARQRAQAFLGRSPNSVLAGRVRRYLGD
jgi:hypothetical protein